VSTHDRTEAAPTPRVLVVDDDHRARRLVAETLAGAGFGIVEAEGGDHALRLLAVETFSAVILDRSMPGLDGIEVLQWIRRTPATSLLPVIVVTGHDEVDDIVAGLSGGADDYVVKPFEPDELVARLRSQLRGRAGWAQLVAQEVERRTALTEAARSAAAAGPVEQAALELCDGMLRLPGTSGTAVVEIVGDGLVQLASKGDDPLVLLGGTDGTGGVARHLVRRARHGAWLEPVVDHATESSTSVAVAPIAVDDLVVGMVLAAPQTTTSRTGADQLLAVAIDFAALASGVFGPTLQAAARRDSAQQRFVAMVERHDFVTMYQPVVDLDEGITVGYEALTRFADEPATEEVFSGAALVGAGTTVELRTLEAAIAESDELPPDAFLALNVSPTLLMDGDALFDRLAPVERPVVIEVSELERVLDYTALRRAIDRLGTDVQLSVDDAGSGFAGLSHILALRAQYVKVDRWWIAGIDRDPARRALVAGLQSFAHETDSRLIAEGIETAEELEAVRRLGIRLGQGFLLGAPETP
jgi:EAL domain-containing protein (putative c-di-GMP-specific phosphodiesterase class I)/DNA-binding response OmpR family regulator